MSRRIRVLCLMMAVLMVFGFTLAGCNKSANNESTEANLTQGTTNAASSEAAPTPLPEVKLMWFVPGPYPQPDQDLVFENANKIIKEKINATVDFQAYNFGEYQEKIKVIQAASESFDICFTAHWFNNYLLNVAKGAFLPLDDLLSTYAPNLLASMSSEVWDAARVNGKIYGVINQQIQARTANMEVVKEYADKYGLDLNIDYTKFKLEDLEPFFERFIAAEKNKFATVVHWKNFIDYYGMEFLAGDSVPAAIMMDDTSLKVFNPFESEQFKSYLALSKKWVEKGYYKSKEYLTAKESGDQIGAGNVAIWFGGTWKPGGEVDASRIYNRPIADRAISPAYLTTNGIIATMFAISRTSKNPERAMMLLELVNSNVELYNMLVFGLEGTHYTKKSGTYIEPVKDNKYAASYSWVWGNNFNAYLTEGQPEDVWEQTKKLNETSKKSPAIGFTFDQTNVTTESSNCGAVIKEYLDGLNDGFLSFEKDYPIFIEKLKKAGSEKIITEMQKQLDAWKAAK